MSSVTKRIREVKQPRGGYIKPSQFTAKKLDDGNILKDNENIHATIIGMVVDYLTRYMMGTELTEAFAISCRGSKRASEWGYNNAHSEAKKYLDGIKGLDEKSIINACKLVTFDVWIRNPIKAMQAKNADQINPDTDTVQNIRIMVERSVSFWIEYGPIIKDGFTFGTTGYTQTVDTGDGDYLTSDTLWDFKISKAKPTNKHTLQLLMYWIMGQHSGKTEFKGITKLGIFNPRLNVVYTLNIDDVPKETIETVESDVICY